MAETSPTETADKSAGEKAENLYPRVAFPKTHPDKLAAIARLFGVEAPPPAQARVLEIGCTDGSNLLPMAQIAPGATFVGIEAAPKSVAAANEAIARAGLQNVEIVQQEILNYQPGEKKFDYIIVHDVFSFVDDPIRAKILAVCKAGLAENGVAYVSYNAFPGWGMRMALREMLLIHTRGLQDMKQKVRQARALMTFLSESVSTENNPYGLLLKQEVERMSHSMSGYLRQGMLDDVNQPFYFHQFVARAAEAGLQYLGEPGLDEMLAAGFPKKVQETLSKTGNNIILREQYMDFLRNRSQRNTLLVHRGIQLNRQLSPAALRKLYFTSTLTVAGEIPADFSAGVEAKFGIRGSKVEFGLKETLAKTVFHTLAEATIRRVSLDEIAQAVKTKAAGLLNIEDPAAIEAEVLRELMQLCMRGVVDIFADRPTLSTKAPRSPLATPLARYQALRGRQVTNRTHISVAFDEIGRYVISNCDGKTSRDAIIEALVQAVKAGKLKASEKNEPIADKAKLRQVMTARVSEVIAKAAAAGFFAEASN